MKPRKAKNGNSSQKIIGIDPGYDRLGMAVIEKFSKGHENILYSGCFRTSSRDSIYERLHQIGLEISRLIEIFRPDIATMETLFIAKNQKTAMRVSEARGVIIYEMTKRHIPIFEYSPMQVKAAITGNGHSDKDHMIKMIHLLVSMPKISSAITNKKRLDDEYDAIAVALTHNAIHNWSSLQK